MLCDKNIVLEISNTLVQDLWNMFDSSDFTAAIAPSPSSSSSSLSSSSTSSSPSSSSFVFSSFPSLLPPLILLPPLPPPFPSPPPLPPFPHPPLSHSFFFLQHTCDVLKKLPSYPYQNVALEIFEIILENVVSIHFTLLIYWNIENILNFLWIFGVIQHFSQSKLSPSMGS